MSRHHDRERRVRAAGKVMGGVLVVSSDAAPSGRTETYVPCLSSHGSRECVACDDTGWSYTPASLLDGGGHQ